MSTAPVKTAGVSVKLVFHDDSVVARRLTLPAANPFAALRALCSAQLRCPIAVITYLDCDRDAVCVESEAELAESLRCAPKSDGSVRYHVAASCEVALAGALKWEKRHSKEADTPARAFDPMPVPPPFPTHSVMPPPPAPHGAAPFVPFMRSMMRHGQAMAARFGPPSPPRCGPETLTPEMQQRADDAAASVMARTGVDADVAASVRAYVEARAAGTERAACVARRRAFMSLHRNGLVAMGKGDHPTACWMIEAASALAPRHPAARYNVGCARALCGDRAGALAALRESVELGWHKARHMREDPDLASLRGDAEFDAVVASIRDPHVRRCEPDAPAAGGAADQAGTAPALCVTKRIEAMARMGAMGFDDEEAVSAALAACGDRVDEAVALMLASRA